MIWNPQINFDLKFEENSILSDDSDQDTTTKLKKYSMTKKHKEPFSIILQSFTKNFPAAKLIVWRKRISIANFNALMYYSKHDLRKLTETNKRITCGEGRHRRTKRPSKKHEPRWCHRRSIRCNMPRKSRYQASSRNMSSSSIITEKWKTRFDVFIDDDV